MNRGKLLNSKNLVKFKVFLHICDISTHKNLSEVSYQWQLSAVSKDFHLNLVVKYVDFCVASQE